MFDFATKMRAEIEDIPGAIQRLLDESEHEVSAAAQTLKEVEPRFISTVARGSSDHAAAYLKYAIELTARVPVASIGPSVSSIYGVDLHLAQSACLAISQSGKSPDIVSMVESARRSGASTIAMTNDPASPLAAAGDHVLDIRAGTESSVAATKTFITSIVSGLSLLAHWQDDHELLAALNKLPSLSQRAIACDWEPLTRRLLRADALYVLGRGPSFAIANEVALKFKETCQIQGEAFSSAEVLHGPVSIVGGHYPVLALISKDAAEPSICSVADRLVEQGGDVFATSDKTANAIQLPFISSGHALCDPLLLAISFYAFVENLARIRGFNPDVPQNLKKVTETV
jgi:glucosamine--fructose-6-phosphate aminotransferase (isomerizing)